MNIEEDLIDLIDKEIFPVLLWVSLYNIYVQFNYSLPQFIRRMICHWKGCNEKGGSGGFNLPIEAYWYGCDRCLAVYSNYEGNTKHNIIPKSESILDRIQELINR